MVRVDFGVVLIAILCGIYFVCVCVGGLFRLLILPLLSNVLKPSSAGSAIAWAELCQSLSGKR